MNEGYTLYSAVQYGISIAFQFHNPHYISFCNNGETFHFWSYSIGRWIRWNINPNWNQCSLAIYLWWEHSKNANSIGSSIESSTALLAKLWSTNNAFTCSACCFNNIYHNFLPTYHTLFSVTMNLIWKKRKDKKWSGGLGIPSVGNYWLSTMETIDCNKNIKCHITI